MIINLDIFETMALATIVFYIGLYLRKKVKLLSKYCIPAPVIGGLLFAVLVLILRITNMAMINLDITLQSVFMTAFFTSVGYTASLKVLKKGGLKVGIFLALATVLVILQDVLGASLATV
ncbi:MAG: sodium/glutamate symporter, partial [Clostridium paraputrificum]